MEEILDAKKGNLTIQNIECEWRDAKINDIF